MGRFPFGVAVLSLSVVPKRVLGAPFESNCPFNSVGALSCRDEDS